MVFEKKLNFFIMSLIFSYGCLNAASDVKDMEQKVARFVAVSCEGRYAVQNMLAKEHFVCAFVHTSKDELSQDRLDDRAKLMAHQTIAQIQETNGICSSMQKTLLAQEKLSALFSMLCVFTKSYLFFCYKVDGETWQNMYEPRRANDLKPVHLSMAIRLLEQNRVSIEGSQKAHSDDLQATAQSLFTLKENLEAKLPVLVFDRISLVNELSQETKLVECITQ